MTTLESRALQYLREAFEDDPNDSLKSTEDIAESLEVPVKDLYDFDTDTGALQTLLDKGKVRKCEGRNSAHHWYADGAQIRWT